jgi:hypothetical protein
LALLSVLGLVGIVIVSPPTYRASAAVVLLNPPAVPTATQARPDIPAEFQNPYVRFGDLSVVVDILVRITGSKEVVDSLKAKGLEGTFTIAANRDFYRGPIVDVVAEHTSSASAINDTKLVIQEIQDELVTLQTQQGTDPSYFIRAEIVVGADRATTVLSGTLRLLIVGAGLGGMLTIGSGLLADAIGRRRRRRSASDDPTHDDESSEDEDQTTRDEPIPAAVPAAASPERRVGGERSSAPRKSESTSPPAVRDRAAEVRRRRAAERTDPARAADHAPADEHAPVAEAASATEQVPATLTPNGSARHTTQSDARLDAALPAGTSDGPVATKRQPKKRRAPSPQVTNDHETPR